MSTMALEKPRYLSIIGAEKTAPASSSVGGSKTAPASSSVDGFKTDPALSIAVIEQRRKRAGISLTLMLGEARLNPKSWQRARQDKTTPRRSTLARADRALDRLIAGERAPAKRAMITSFYLLTVSHVARLCEVDGAIARAMATDFQQEKPQDPAWLICARVRRIAMYLIACEWDHGRAALANAIGCSRQNLFQAVKSIEALRETEPALDALIAQLAVCGKVA